MEEELREQYIPELMRQQKKLVFYIMSRRCSRFFRWCYNCHSGSSWDTRLSDLKKFLNLQTLLGKKGFSADIIQLNKDGKPLYALLELVIKE
ncbi:RP534-like protein [Rickettsia conorii str. Malish 7]|uniref:RP534-like protein n=2 Tax=Rickettsia conorii TaxID=781 RepID=Q92HJ5_RICCN|nr:RP534-like protein [Rickettsia conorii str. Malish 7]